MESELRGPGNEVIGKGKTSYDAKLSFQLYTQYFHAVSDEKATKAELKASIPLQYAIVY